MKSNIDWPGLVKMKEPHPFLCDYITMKGNQQFLHLLLALVSIVIKQKNLGLKCFIFIKKS